MPEVHCIGRDSCCGPGGHGCIGAAACDHTDAEAPVRGTGRTRFKIQYRFTYGWDDFERSIPEVMESDPVTYATQDEAATSLYEFIRDVNAAVRAGHLESGYARNEFRVVPVED